MNIITMTIIILNFKNEIISMLLNQKSDDWIWEMKFHETMQFRFRDAIRFRPLWSRGVRVGER